MAELRVCFGRWIGQQAGKRGPAAACCPRIEMLMTQIHCPPLLDQAHPAVRHPQEGQLAVAVMVVPEVAWSASRSLGHEARRERSSAARSRPIQQLGPAAPAQLAAGKR